MRTLPKPHNQETLLGPHGIDAAVADICAALNAAKLDTVARRAQLDAREGPRLPVPVRRGRPH